MEIRVLALIILSFIAGFDAENGEVQHNICDDGKTNIEADISSEDLGCNGEKIVLHEYFQPAGVSHCLDEKEIAIGKQQCMGEPILFDTPLPMSGSYRPLSPQYGEYSYLPPQRWLHGLKYGAVVFLYHPCAPLDQVMELKRLARSCLWKHLITPSPKLSLDKPFALLSWGCSYMMSWVDWDPAVEWIKLHALKTPESLVTENGQYNYSLIEPSHVVSTIDDNIICPTTNKEGENTQVNNPDVHNSNSSLDSATTSSSTPSNSVPSDNTHGNSVPGNSTHGNSTHSNSVPSSSIASNDANQGVDTSTSNSGASTSGTTNGNNCTSKDDSFACGHHSYVVITLHDYPILYGLIVVLGVVIFTLTVFLVLVCCCKRSSSCPLGGSRKRPLGRYKPCGQFYKGNGNGLTAGIAIPELGLPKTVPSEREKLLIESDEDDL